MGRLARLNIDWERNWVAGLVNSPYDTGAIRDAERTHLLGNEPTANYRTYPTLSAERTQRRLPSEPTVGYRTNPPSAAERTHCRLPNEVISLAILGPSKATR
jgi:hypothetical protein